CNYKGKQILRYLKAQDGVCALGCIAEAFDIEIDPFPFISTNVDRETVFGYLDILSQHHKAYKTLEGIGFNNLAIMGHNDQQQHSFSHIAGLLELMHIGNIYYPDNYKHAFVFEGV